ncbi:MAG: ceramidase domain-containing protein [Myxococcota bacterium]
METCPWSGWEAASVSFCEARLCAWVAEPSNAWSSLAYVALGGWLLTRPESRRSWLLGGVALANVMIGLGSFAFHASGTFAGELIDLFGMFLLSGLILAHALGRGRWRREQIAAAWAAFVIVPMAVVLVVKPAGIPLFALALVSGIGLELHAWRRGRSPHFRIFAQALGLVSTAFAIWVTDTTRLLCAPDNHVLTGHALWHALNAIAVTRLFFFYARGEDRTLTPLPVAKLVT